MYTGGYAKESLVRLKNTPKATILNVSVSLGGTDNGYGSDSSIIVHCNMQVDNMNGKSANAILTLSALGRSIQKIEGYTPNYDSCIWNDFRFPIYLNEITSLIGEGQYQINAVIELFDDQNRCMTSYSCFFNLKYSHGLFSGAKFEFF